MAEKLSERLDEMGKDLTSMIEEVNGASSTLSKTNKADEPVRIPFSPRSLKLMLMYTMNRSRKSSASSTPTSRNCRSSTKAPRSSRPRSTPHRRPASPSLRGSGMVWVALVWAVVPQMISIALTWDVARGDAGSVDWFSVNNGYGMVFLINKDWLLSLFFFYVLFFLLLSLLFHAAVAVAGVLQCNAINTNEMR